MAKSVRRVVTGHDADGKAVFVSDGQPPSAVTLEQLAGYKMTHAWYVDWTPTGLSDGGELPAGPLPFEPPPGGVRWVIVEFPPEKDMVAHLDMEALVKELGAKMPGFLERSDPSRFGMHRTDTIDFGVILSGEIWLELEDSELHLKAGDCVVQRGTWHAWHNRSTEPCILSAVMISTQPT